MTSKSKEGDVYPPRIRLDIYLTDTPRTPLICDIKLSGMEFDRFALKAAVHKETRVHNARYPRLVLSIMWGVQVKTEPC